MTCEVCDSPMTMGGLATEVYRRGHTVVVVTGIPAIAVCPECENAILDWDVAQAVEDIVQPLLKAAARGRLPAPAVSITFPTQLPMAV